MVNLWQPMMTPFRELAFSSWAAPLAGRTSSIVSEVFGLEVLRIRQPGRWSWVNISWTSYVITASSAASAR